MYERTLTDRFGVERFLGPAPGDDAVAAAVRTAVAQHRVVLLRGLSWNEDRQVAVSAAIGTVLAGNADRTARSRPAVRHELGNDRYADRWHADGSWARTDSLSLLYCVEASSAPEPTLFLDTVSALDLLDAEQRRAIDGREVTHDLRRSRRRRPAATGESKPGRRGRRLTRGLARRLSPRGAQRPGPQPLVVPRQQHRAGTTYRLIDHCPVTGVDFLRLGDHAHSVSGLRSRASTALLERLHRSIDRSETTWRHGWEPGDLVVYDNRMVLHRRGGVAGRPAGRVLRRTMVEWPSLGGGEISPRRTV